MASASLDAPLIAGNDDSVPLAEDISESGRQLIGESVDAVLAWDFMNSVAFWASIFFIQGSVLFTVGSICLYPGAIPEGAEEWVSLAWIDYSFMIGAWCFTIGNYLVYFQVINGEDTGRAAGRRRRTCLTRRKWLAAPRRESGHLGSLCNCVGAVLFNMNTMTMFAASAKSTMAGFNFWYVFTGAGGSAFFVFGAIFEGEHNDWRRLSLKRFTELPFLMSVLNFLGGVLFFVAYIVDVNKTADTRCEAGDCMLTIHGVAGTFTVGSIFFIISSWMSLWMWKSQDFGLSFAKTVVGHSITKVDIKQQLMLVIYCSNICMAWLKLGFLMANLWKNEVTFFLDTGLKLLAYFCIMFLASAVHTTPARHPYDYVFW